MYDEWDQGKPQNVDGLDLDLDLLHSGLPARLAPLLSFSRPLVQFNVSEVPAANLIWRFLAFSKPPTSI